MAHHSGSTWADARGTSHAGLGRDGGSAQGGQGGASPWAPPRAGGNPRLGRQGLPQSSGRARREGGQALPAPGPQPLSVQRSPGVLFVQLLPRGCHAAAREKVAPWHAPGVGPPRATPG